MILKTKRRQITGKKINYNFTVKRNDSEPFNYC